MYGQYFGSCEKTFSVVLLNYHQCGDISQMTFLTNRFFSIYLKIVFSIDEHYLCKYPYWSDLHQFLLLSNLLDYSQINVNKFYLDNQLLNFLIINIINYLIKNDSFDWPFG